MTYIPRKDEYDNNNDNSKENEEKVRWSESWVAKKSWIDIIDESGVIGGICTLFAYFTIFYNVISAPDFRYLFKARPAWYSQGLGIAEVAVVCDIILLFLIIVSMRENGITPKTILIQILHFIGSFGKPLTEEQKRDILNKMEEDRKNYRNDYDAQIEKARRENGYYESLKKPDDGKDFNTRQKEERRARAYEKADPEFEVTYRSKGGCWVRDIVRGRDKAEVLNRYRHNPMVEQMGGVVGIEE